MTTASSFGDTAPSIPLVFAVVLNWNGHADTKRCVSALGRQTYNNLKVLVVDNGSTDQSLEALKGGIDNESILSLPINRGFAGGMNCGIHLAINRGAHYVWLVNNDAVPQEDALERLIDACATRPDVGLVSPAVRDPVKGHSSQLGLGRFDLSVPMHEYTVDLAIASRWQRDDPHHVTLAGTALLISKRLVNAIGALDERFFAYWEDTDYSIRSALAGFRNILVPGAIVDHPNKEPGSAAARVAPHYYYFMARNEIFLWRKFTSGRRFIKATLWLLRRQLKQISIMPNYTEGVHSIISGVIDGLMGVGGASRVRNSFPVHIIMFVILRTGALWCRTWNARG